MNIVKKIRLGYVGEFKNCNNINEVLKYINTDDDSLEEVFDIDLTDSHKAIHYIGCTYYLFDNGKLYKRMSPCVVDDVFTNWKSKKTQSGVPTKWCMVGYGGEKGLKFGCTVYTGSGNAKIAVYFNKRKINEYTITEIADNETILESIKKYTREFCDKAASINIDNPKFIKEDYYNGLIDKRR